MTIDLMLEKKFILTAEQLYSLRLMLRVDMVYKTQASITGACKAVANKVNADNKAQLVDAAAQHVTPIVADHVEEWYNMDRSLTRALDIAGYTMTDAKPEVRIAVFVNDTVFTNLKNVVLNGFYNAVRTTNIEEEVATDSGAALGKALMKSRQGILDALASAEVGAQDVQAGVFTFAAPAPKGNFAN